MVSSPTNSKLNHKNNNNNSNNNNNNTAIHHNVGVVGSYETTTVGVGGSGCNGGGSVSGSGVATLASVCQNDMAVFNLLNIKYPDSKYPDSIVLPVLIL